MIFMWLFAVFVWMNLLYNSLKYIVVNHLFQSFNYREFWSAIYKELFQKGLNIEDPWYIKDIDFDPELKRLDIRIDFKKGSKFPCPKMWRSKLFDSW